MTCPHEVDVGAYVLDVLEPDERMRVAAHLARCPYCAAELEALQGLPALLATVPPPDPAVTPPVPSETAFHRLRRSAAVAPAPGTSQDSRTPGGRSRRWLLVAAAAVVVGIGGVTAAVVTGGRAAPTTVSAHSGDLSVRASIAPLEQGSRITLALHGVPSGHRCELTVQASDGHWETASVWTADYEGDAHVTSEVPIHPDDLRRLVIRNLDGTTLLSLPG